MKANHFMCLQSYPESVLLLRMKRHIDSFWMRLKTHGVVCSHKMVDTSVFTQVFRIVQISLKQMS